MTRLVIRSCVVWLFVANASDSPTAVGDQALKLSSPVVSGEAVVGDRFGISVDLDGNRAVVGAPLHEEVQAPSPAFVFDTESGDQLAMLLAPNTTARDRFGRSVAISGNVAIVGAPGPDTFEADRGAAYLFDVTASEQLRRLTAADASANDRFGSSVSISGDMAIVGAWGHGNPDYESGAAYLFDVPSGQQLSKLTATDGQWFDHFGYSVDIDGEVAIVGARGDDDLGFGSGAAYIFDTDTGQQVFKLTAPDGRGGDHFGTSVAISGNIAIVGALKDDERPDVPGSAYLFDVRTGAQLAQLSAPDGESVDEFGISVDVDGTRAVVGAWQDSNQFDREGSAYLFDVASGQMVSKVGAFDAQPYDQFGASVALDGDKLIVAAPGWSDRSGAAYVLSSTIGALLPGDADQDLDVDQHDIVQVRQAGKYLTQLPATWSEGDWDGAPGGQPGSPPRGDGFFNQADIVSVLDSGVYLTGPYAVRQPSDSEHAGNSIVYDVTAGELAIDTTTQNEFASIKIDFAAADFTVNPTLSIGSGFGEGSDDSIVNGTLDSSMGSFSFDDVALPHLTGESIMGDLNAVDTLAGVTSQATDDVVYVPEPSTILLVAASLVVVLCRGWPGRRHDVKAIHDASQT